MNDILYETSLTAYALPDPTPPLIALLSASTARLSDQARTLRDHLSTGRVAYEREEEQEKIGGLRECSFTLLRQDDAVPYGIAVTLLYDKISYKFLLYGDAAPSSRTTSKGKQRQPEQSISLLLVKASSSVTARFFSFLDTHFQAPPVIPLKLPAAHLPTALNAYINALVASHQTISADHALLDFLRDTIGILKLTISITNAEVAKSLRSIDIDIPPETLYQFVTDTESEAQSGFLSSLYKHLRARTGLLLPLVPPPPGPRRSAGAADPPQPEEDPPLKLYRLSCAAFALSSEGRLKLSARSVQLVDAIPGLGSGEENVVRRANLGLLRGLVEEATKLGEEDLNT